MQGVVVVVCNSPPPKAGVNFLFGQRKEEFFLFNDALNTFYLRLNGVGHIVKDYSDRER